MNAIRQCGIRMSNHWTVYYGTYTGLYFTGVIMTMYLTPALVGEDREPDFELALARIMLWPAFFTRSICRGAWKGLTATHGRRQGRSDQ